MYAKDVLVDAQWLQDHVRDPWVRVVSVGARGEIPGAIALDRRELEEPVRRDVLGPDALGDLLGARGISDEHTIVLCGEEAAYAERSAHTWFVLHELPGRREVKNYDGGWLEWGNLVGVPICASTSTPARPISPPTWHRSPAVPPRRSWS